MVTYRKVWTLIGHSNAEGFAGSSPMYAHGAVPAPLGPKGGYSAAPVANKPDNFRTHPGLKMFMSANDWPVGTTNPSPPVSAIGTGAWKDITLDYSRSPAYANHAYSPPYSYPSGRSIPFSPDAYIADGTGTLPYDTGGGALTGVELPLAYFLSQYWGEEVYGVKLAIPSSYLLRFDAGSSAYSKYAWWSPLDDFDFEPPTGRLYSKFIDKMTGAAAALPAGESMDVRLGIIWCGDNDSALVGGTPRIENFKDVYLGLIETYRDDMVTNGWTTLPKEQIPVAMMGIYKTYATPNRDIINAWLQEIAQEDPYAFYIETLDLESLATAGFTDASHISHNGYVEAATRIVEALKEVDIEPLDAMDADDLVTVDEVRSRVRTFYENNRVRTGATSDDNLLVHINAALTHINSKMSDQAYWLRKRETIAVSGSAGSVIELSPKIHRVLRIEDQNEVSRILRFREIGRANGGKLQIQLETRGAGNYVFHYIELPKELTRDAQKVPLPRVALEWLVAEVSRRVARSTNNVQLQVALAQESSALHADVAKHAAAMTRARNDRLRVQQNLRGRIGLHQGRYRTYPWR